MDRPNDQLPKRPVESSILLRNLEIGYRKKNCQNVVATGINASLNSGQLTCLIGPNGIGKSTLLRTLSASQPALSGEVIVLGHPISEYTKRQLSQMIGLVLTERPDVRNMTVRELISLGRTPYTGFWGTLSASDYEIVDKSMELIGIQQLGKRLMSALSDGERQKVMIAKALAQQTDIIFLDEPTAFLDFPSKVEMMQLLRRLAKSLDKTIFMSTHDVELALQLADMLWLMQKATLHTGTPRELADAGTLSDFIEHPGIVFSPKDLQIRVE